MPTDDAITYRVAGPVPALYVQVDGRIKARETVADFNKIFPQPKYAANLIETVRIDRLIFTGRVAGPDLMPLPEDRNTLDLSGRGLVVLVANEWLTVPDDLHLIFDVPGRTNSARAGNSADRATAYIQNVAMPILGGCTARTSDPFIAAQIKAELDHNRLFWTALRELPRKNPHL